MKLGRISILKFALALLGVAAFIFICLGAAWMYGIATIPPSETLTLAELGNATNRVLKTVTVPFASDERNIHLQWAWDAPSNRTPEIHVVCDLVNEAKDPVLFLVEGTEADYAKIQPGNSTIFFDGNLTDLIFARKVHFRTEPMGKMKKLTLRMRFDQDFTPAQPIKVQLFLYRAML